MQTPEPVWTWQRKGQMVTGGFLISGFLLFNFSCTDPTSFTPPDTDTLSFRAGVTDLTEMELELHVTGALLPAPATLTRGGEPVLSFSLHQAETTLTVTGLTPSTDYTWQALLERTGKPVLKSMPLKTRTMDTTSHDFTWKVDYFGGYRTSNIYDIVIINDTLAFAVGMIKTDPATDPDTSIYKGSWNLIVWNGKEWKLQKLWYEWEGQPYFGTIEWVGKVDDKTVWFSNGVVWNETSFKTSLDLINGMVEIFVPKGVGVNKIWGSSKNTVYAVGDKGTAAFWNGTTWTAIETGTNLHFYDIWGDGDEVLAVASHSEGHEKLVYRLYSTGAEEINLNGVTKRVFTGWFIKNKIYYLAGSGLYKKRKLSDAGWYHYPDGQATDNGSYQIRGTTQNNVFVVGGLMELVHFNGSTWRNLSSQLPLSNSVIGALSVYNKMVMVIGFNEKRGLIVTGYQNQ